MDPETESLPDGLRLPTLPPGLEEWFAFAASLGDDTEVMHDGAIVDGLGVVDAESARRALVGYRFVIEDGGWVDEAARGGWRESWIVVESIDADPFIADLSAPGIPVSEAPHGAGAWRPTPVAATLTEFIASLEVNDDAPGPPPLHEDLLTNLAVWAIDLGPEPLTTLLKLNTYPLVDSFPREEMLRMRAHLPARLASRLTREQAEACVEFGARFGAVFEVRDDGADAGT